MDVEAKKLNALKSLVLVFALATPLLFLQADSNNKKIGREVALTRHLRDDEEFQIPLHELIEHGKKVFCANFTDQEGAGRPLTKGTGKAVSDSSSPLVGARAWNRISGPDANKRRGRIRNRFARTFCQRTSGAFL